MVWVVQNTCEQKKKEDLSGNGQDIKDAKGKADNVE